VRERGESDLDGRRGVRESGLDGISVKVRERVIQREGRIVSVSKRG
jgi:hypothetical protein